MSPNAEYHCFSDMVVPLFETKAMNALLLLDQYINASHAAVAELRSSDHYDLTLGPDWLNYPRFYNLFISYFRRAEQSIRFFFCFFFVLCFFVCVFAVVVVVFLFFFPRRTNSQRKKLEVRLNYSTNCSKL